MKLTESNLLRNWVSAVLLGKNPGYKVKGTTQQLKALSEALMATRLFEREMAKPDATVESVLDCLDRKHKSVQRFEKVFGKKSWPL